MLYHASPQPIKLKKNTDKILNHSGEFGDIIGLWCSPSKTFCKRFVKLTYKVRPVIYSVFPAFEDDLVFDSRKKEHMELLVNIIVRPNKNHKYYFFNFCVLIGKISRQKGDLAEYFDTKLKLPCYIVADLLIPEIQKLGFKAIYFSETLPYQSSKKDSRVKGLDGVASCLILDPYTNIKKLIKL